LKKSEFCLSANRQLIMSRFSEKVPSMTLIYIKPMEDAEVSADVMKEIVCSCGDLIKIQSIGKDTAGLIADGILAFVHHELNLKVLIEQLYLLIGKTTGQAKNIKISTETVYLAASADITENDSAQAIMFTIDHIVAGRGKDVDHGSLDDFYAEMVEITVEKISDFRQTIEEDLFDLAFQPIVEVATGAISHFEVLTRLRSSSKFSNPFQFIEFGEDIGMIPDYDFKMVCRSIDVLKKHKEQNTKPHLAVNLSGSSLSSKLFLDKLYTLLTKNIEFCPQLMFEITESSKIGDMRAANEYIRKVKKLGVKIGIDDFGAGEATFEYLRHLDVDVVKIDGSYLATKNAEDKEYNLLKSLSALCKDLGIDVIAERVETHEDKEIVRNCGIKYAQGYYYAKPNTDSTVLNNTASYEEKTAQIKNIADYRS
jgi:EAL domain-containing protein (putative c-di-GMP-specific phosphodiesterase class I)